MLNLFKINNLYGLVGGKLVNQIVRKLFRINTVYLVYPCTKWSPPIDSYLVYLVYPLLNYINIILLIIYIFSLLKIPVLRTLLQENAENK